MVACGAVLLLMTGCAGMERRDTMAMDKRSLNERLGGKPAIAAVVDDQRRRRRPPQRPVHACRHPSAQDDARRPDRQASGGPCVYTGQTMTDAHRGMHISDGDFGALVEDLVRSLDRFKVPATEKDELPVRRRGGCYPRPVTAADNLFGDLPGAPMPAERVDVLAQAPGLRLERIISTGHVTPAGDWYDQSTDEWVAVLQGSARLIFEGDASQTLTAGDHVLIPAHRRHRVEWTDPSQPTVWLALHYTAVPQPPA